jgi:hypothetical protein
MPIVGDAKKVRNSMEDTYGSKEKAERVFYATANKQKRDHKNWKKEAWELGLGKVAVEILRGGEGDGIAADQLDPQALAKGMKEEGEHTSNLALRKEIATDHLAKDRKYYDKLEKMEKKAVAPPPSTQLPVAKLPGPGTGATRPPIQNRPVTSTTQLPQQPPAQKGGGLQLIPNNGPCDQVVPPQNRSKTLKTSVAGGVPGGKASVTSPIGAHAASTSMTTPVSPQIGSVAQPLKSPASPGFSDDLSASQPTQVKTSVELRRLGAYAIRYLGGI